MPPRAIALMNSIRIKWIATQVGIEKLVLKQGKMIGYFVSDQQSDYYQSKRFMSVMDFVQKQTDLCKMKEKQTKWKLLMTLTMCKSTRRNFRVDGDVGERD
jgi:transcription-repair coupling factor (superfamily II helicase)